MLLLLATVQTPLGEVLKLPLLAEHFLDHQSRDALSFAGFLDQHYSGSHSDADQSEDEQLPFKTIDMQSMAAAIVSPLFQTDFDKEFAPPARNAAVKSYTPGIHYSGVFHPPRA